MRASYVSSRARARVWPNTFACTCGLSRARSTGLLVPLFSVFQVRVAQRASRAKGRFFFWWLVVFFSVASVSSRSQDAIYEFVDDEATRTVRVSASREKEGEDVFVSGE